MNRIRPMIPRESAVPSPTRVQPSPVPRPSGVRPVPVETAIGSTSSRVHVVVPTRFGDAKEIADRLKDNRPVIVNLQVADRDLQRRMIDFCSGVTYALSGEMEKVADQVFLLARRSKGFRGGAATPGGARLRTGLTRLFSAGSESFSVCWESRRAYIWLIMLPMALLSWFRIQPGTTLARVQLFLYRATEPVLRPVRRIIRPSAASISPSWWCSWCPSSSWSRSCGARALPADTRVVAPWVDSAPMDSSPTSSSILDTLRTVEFRLGIKGYNVDEVDEYLDRAAQEAEALQENLRQLNDRLRQAGDRIVQLEKEAREAEAAPPEPAAAARCPRSRSRRPAPVAPAGAGHRRGEPPALRRDVAADAVAGPEVRRPDQARERGRGGRHGGPSRGEGAGHGGRRRAAAKTLETESQRQVREEVARLEATRTELATDVESMARHLESERNRLRDALSEILNWVDENVQPANSLMGVRPKAARPPTPAAIAPLHGPGDGGVDVDDQPTLNLESVADATETGAPRTRSDLRSPGSYCPLRHSPLWSPAPSARSPSGDRPLQWSGRRTR